jgi:hypothetical protein
MCEACLRDLLVDLMSLMGKAVGCWGLDTRDSILLLLLMRLDDLLLGLLDSLLLRATL